MPIGSDKPKASFKIRDNSYGKTISSSSPSANYKPKLKFVES